MSTTPPKGMPPPATPAVVRLRAQDFLHLSPEVRRPALQRAMEFVDRRQFPEAQKELDALDPADPNVAYLRGELLSRQGGEFASVLAAYRRAVDLGHPLAMFFAANVMLSSAAGLRDPARAFELFQNAYAKGVDEAGVNLAQRFYLDGELGKRDQAKALEINTALAAKKNPTALNNLGAQYEGGLGTAPDPAKALVLFVESAELGNPTAMANAGRMMIQGKGVPRDMPRGTQWLNKAIDAGFLPATMFLGHVYLRPFDSSPPDPLLAAQTFRKGALKNFGPAQFSLAQLYEDGLGLPRDLPMAYLYYGLANANGHQAGLAKLAPLDTRMSAGERERAKTLLEAALPKRR